jgi:hypothetical protein
VLRNGPYVIAGHAVCDDANIVLTSIETCVPNCPTRMFSIGVARILGNRDDF